MGRKNKQLILEDLVIEDIAAEGKAMGRVDGKIVFVPFVAPGDVVDVRVRKNKKKYYEGTVINVKKQSDLRIEPRCEHFGTCGGCNWQHIPYELQLKAKQQQVLDQFERLGGLKDFTMYDILASEKMYYYRNKLEFSFSNSRWLSSEEIQTGEESLDKRGLGFYMPKKYFRILDIKNCHLQEEPSNAIRLALRSYVFENNIECFDQITNKGFIRSTIIRSTSKGEWLVIVTFHHKSPLINEILDHLMLEIPQITSVHYVINPKTNDVITDLETIHYSGEEYITEEMEGIRFRISPKSFYQTNSQQGYNLYKVAREFAGLTGNEIVYDLYTGTGTIANFIAGNCDKVIGVEYVEEAILDAKRNSVENEIENTMFFAGDMRKVLTSEFISEHGQPDVIITDPPRAGMHGDVIKTLLNAAPEKIVYVSCNPSTQVRDIQLLSESYRLIQVQPVDMFPQTHHVENVALLVRK